MIPRLIILILFFSVKTVFAQVSIKTGGIFFAKDFSKEIALYNAKTFLIKDILGQTNELIQFEIDPLTASNSGELTSLVYRCPIKKKEGLILGFYGLRWNDAGVNYQAYAFKDLPTKEANELLDKIEEVTKDNSKYIDSDPDNNNIYFQYDDITILIYNTLSSTKLRVFWNGFDSEWEWSTFKKTKKRLLKKLK
jgi:hypothetical protein